MRILPEHTLAVAIDFQERLAPVIHEKDEVIARAALLTEGLQHLNIPLIVTRQYPKGLGDTVPAVKTVAEDAAVLDKTTFSIYDDALIRRTIQEKQPETVLLYGIETHICVSQSAVDLKEAGYDVFVVSDACGSRTTRDHHLGLERFRHEGIGLLSVEAILFELTRSAKNPVFKTISNLIK